MYEFRRLMACNISLLCFLVGFAIVFSVPCLAAEGDDVFLKIKPRAQYMVVVISFDIKEGALSDNPQGIEVLRADRKNGKYEVIGMVDCMAGKTSYVYRDDKVKKTSYYYMLRVKGKDITSKPFKGRAYLVPPST